MLVVALLRLSASSPRSPPNPSPTASTAASTRRRSTGSLWGVALVDEKGPLLYGRNQRQLFIPASNTKLVVAAVASALLPPDWTVQDQPLRRGPVADGVCRATWCSTAGATRRFGKRCFATDTLREGACETDSVHPAARAGGGLRGARASARSTATWSATAATSSRPPVHPGWEAFDLNWWYAAPVSGARLQRQQRRLRPGVPARRRARRR